MVGNTISVQRVIAAPPGAIFAVVADASRHADIDGSGSVKHLKAGAPQHLALGSTFAMSMKQGLPYSMANTVVEFEPDRRIAWQTRLPGPLGRFAGGRVWRYEFDPVEGGTSVTETWDITRDSARAVLRHGPVPRQVREAMTKTLTRLAELTEPASGDGTAAS